MAATQSAASEGPAASMAAPCGDGLWARPSWHGPFRTAEAQAPLGSLSGLDGLLGPSAEGSCCEMRAPELKPPTSREVSCQEFCCRTWNCVSKGFASCCCQGNRMTNPAEEETIKANLD